MKFTAAKNDLMNGVAIAIRAVPAHTTMPILECMLLQTEGQALKLTTNDTEMGIETVVPAQIQEPGTIAVDARMLSEIVRKLPDSVVSFESDENDRIQIRCGKARFNIAGQKGDDFSFLPSVDQDESITLSQLTLKSVIQQTIFSIAANENNKIMTGELFEIKGDILRVVALDGHRIAMRRVALKNSFDERRVIVPGKTLLEISRILSGEIDEQVSVFFSRNHIVFELPGTRMVSRLIDGEYFNVDQMISTDYETKLTISRNEFQSCIDRALLFVRENDKKPIIFDITDGEVRLSIDSPMGSFDESIDIQKEGRDLTIGFNPRFLLDALKVIDDENVTLYLVNAKAPCFIRNDDDTYTYLILPVNFVR